MPSLQAGAPVELAAETLVGRLDPAFWVYRWRGPQYPTLIVHHGNNERPFDLGRFAANTFRPVLMEGEPFLANLIILRAPFHRSTQEYMVKIGELSNFVAMLAVSVALIEELVWACKQQSDQPVLVTGISLGGWVTNLHRAYYNSADRYLPLLAGAALAEVFLTSGYQKLTGQPGRENPDILRHILNFEDEYVRVADNNVDPLLARHDQFIQFDRQKHCYGDRPIRVLGKGHIATALASGDLRQHLLDPLKNNSQLTSQIGLQRQWR